MNRKILKTPDIKHIRNFTISAHIDAGKTTTTECILLHSGIIYKQGNIDNQDTQMDWRFEERSRGITIMSDTTSCIWKNHYLNIIDTPGHRDFSAEVIRCLTSIDFVLGVFCAVGGIEPQTRFIWSKIEDYKLPAICFINKIDRLGANYFETIDEINESFQIRPIPIILPIGQGDNFLGIIDLIDNICCLFINKKQIVVSYQEFKNNFDKYVKLDNTFEKFRNSIHDDYELYKYYIYQETNSEDKKTIIMILKQKLIKKEITLVLCGSAKYNIGIIFLLNHIINFSPSPLERNKGEFKLFPNNNEKQNIIIANTTYKYSIIYIFKIVFDKFLGRITYAKVFSGSIFKSQFLFNTKNNKRERISRIVKIHANKKSDLLEAKCGDIIGIVGFKNSITNDTLCNIKDFDYSLKKISFPESIITKSIKPITKKDQENLSDALLKTHISDPTIQYKVDSVSGEIIMSGLGELHLDVNISMLKTRYNVSVISGKPKIAFKETITNKVNNIKGDYIRQSGGRGHFGVVFIDLEPCNENFIFVNAMRGQDLDKRFIPGIEIGIKNFLLSGTHAKCPVINIKVTLLRGESHPVDSSELSFINATYQAMKNAYEKANPKLLEPIMLVTINTPKDFLGVITSDIFAKRGKIVSIKEKQYNFFGKIEIKNIITAKIPLESLSGYSDHILSLSKGGAIQAGMELFNYEFIPDNIEEKKVKLLLNNYLIKHKK